MANVAVTLDAESLRALYAWLDAVPLSRPKKNIAEDFSDGVMMAEVLNFFVPRLVDLSLYPTGTEEEAKRSNWKLLNQNVFSSLEIRISDYTIVQLVDAKTGVIEQVLWELRRKLQDTAQSYSTSVEVLDAANMGFTLRDVSGLTEVGKDKHLWKSLLSEFLGTLILVLIGCGSTLQWGHPAEMDASGKVIKESTLTDKPSTVQVSIAFGFTFATMSEVIGHVSGCQVNPAVTIGNLVAMKVKPVKALMCIVFQCVGAISGAAILKALSPEGGANLGVTTIHPDVTLPQACALEFLITMVLVLTVFGATDENRQDIKGSISLGIGLSITACHLAAMKYTGSSMNPARSFGPAVMTGIWTDHWVYWVGPMLGGLVGGFVYNNALQSPKIQRSEGGEITAKGDL